MDPVIKAGLWQQFGATIDMLDSAILACPDELWAAYLWDDPDGQHNIRVEDWYTRVDRMD